MAGESAAVGGRLPITSDMAQPQVTIRSKSPGTLPGALPGALPGVPKRALDAEQQLEALRRAQSQAEQRVKLGVQLFKAAEARTAQHRDDVEQLRKQQDQLREQLQQDIARSFQSYDQWIAKVDDTLTNSLKSIEDRIEQLQSRWKETEQRIATMIDRSQALLTQSVNMTQPPAHPMTFTPPPAPPQPMSPGPVGPLSHAPQPADEQDEGEKPPFNPIYTHALRRLSADRNGNDDGPRAA
jgi:hypothetical protein